VRVPVYGPPRWATSAFPPPDSPERAPRASVAVTIERPRSGPHGDRESGHTPSSVLSRDSCDGARSRSVEPSPWAWGPVSGASEPTGARRLAAARARWPGRRDRAYSPPLLLRIGGGAASDRAPPPRLPSGWLWHTPSIANADGSATDVLVLCYHAVSEDWDADLSVKPERLASQIELMLTRGYRGATFHEAVHSPPAPRTFAITFDDAYRSVIELAFPVLSRLGVPGTVFVPTGFTGSDRPMEWPGIDHWIGGPHEAELLPMTWQDLATLARAGWEIGAHTRTHPHLTELDDATLAEEIRASKRDIESRLGLDCRSFAYPYPD